MTANLFDNIPDASKDEIFETILEKGAVKIERITSRGQVTAQGEWLISDRDEWVLLIQGGAQLEYESGKTVELIPGDYLLIPAQEKHRVAWTDEAKDSIWLTVYYNRD